MESPLTSLVAWWRHIGHCPALLAIRLRQHWPLYEFTMHCSGHLMVPPLHCSHRTSFTVERSRVILILLWSLRALQSNINITVATRWNDHWQYWSLVESLLMLLVSRWSNCRKNWTLETMLYSVTLLRAVHSGPWDRGLIRDVLCPLMVILLLFINYIIYTIHWGALHWICRSFYSGHT